MIDSSLKRGICSVSYSNIDKHSGEALQLKSYDTTRCKRFFKFFEEYGLMISFHEHDLL